MTIEAAESRRKQAADWFARLNQRRVTADDVKAFSAWRRDPENAAAYAGIEALWDTAGNLAGAPNMAALVEDARTRAAGRPRRERLVGVLKPLGAAGAALVVAAGLGWVWFLQQPVTYATEVGEQRVVVLDDGSRITLDTASSIRVRYTGERRSVSLTEGQALFDVEGDPARPFVVTAGDAEVTALGTRFDVRRLTDGARVVLIEGRVAVRDAATPERTWSLNPGQQVVTSAPQPVVASVSIPVATSWTTGRLIFEDTPVAVAVAEVNRYTRNPIEIRDGGVAANRVSGAFDAADVDGFVAALTDLYPLEVRRSPDGRIILAGAP